MQTMAKQPDGDTPSGFLFPRERYAQRLQHCSLANIGFFFGKQANGDYPGDLIDLRFHLGWVSNL